jgi:hypothetical protein
MDLGLRKPSEKEQQLSYNDMAGFGQPRCAHFCVGPNKGHATLVGQPTVLQFSRLEIHDYVTMQLKR